MKYCDNCKNVIDDADSVCPICGAELKRDEGKVRRFTYKLTGYDIPLNFKLSDFFSGVFTRHSKSEEEDVFIAGTRFCTVDSEELTPTLPKPWLYSRIFLLLLAAFAMCYICVSGFSNANLLPALILMGSLAIPFSFLILIFEINIPKNISIFEVVKIFFVGGIASLITTLILTSIFGDTGSEFLTTTLFALLEEVAKAAIVIFIVKKSNCKYVLNGLLIGAAVGAGFAVFESSGYALRYYMSYGFNSMMNVITTRGFLSFGGHISWAAVEGAALILVKGEEKLTAHHVGSKRFLLWFFSCALLHTIWNLPFEFLPAIWGKHIILSIIVLIMVGVMINVGSYQALLLSCKARQNRAAEKQDADDAAQQENVEGA